MQKKHYLCTIIIKWTLLFMKKNVLKMWGFVAFLIISLAACNKHEQSGVVPSDEKDSISVVHDSLLVVVAPDDAIWGHLGEGTAMSSVEFVTEAGDTLYLSKSDELSGREATILGSLRNFTDRFCIVVNADTSALVKAINVTEMQEIWAEDNYQVEK